MEKNDASTDCQPPTRIDDLPLGARVYARAESGICSKGSRGLVVEEYWLGERPGRTILFENGGYDGFSPDDIGHLVIAEGSIDSKLAHYCFQSVGRLSVEFHSGLFDFTGFEPFAQRISNQEKSAISSQLPTKSNDAISAGKSTSI